MQLQPLTEERCLELLEWRNANLQALRTPYMLTGRMQKQFYQEVVCNQSSNHRYWAICSNDGILLACGGITNIQWENGLGEISMIAANKLSGIGTQSVDLLLDQAFNYMGLETVFGECYMCNSAVVFWEKICEKFKAHTALIPGRKRWAGEIYGSMLFSIAVSDYRAVQQS